MGKTLIIEKLFLGEIGNIEQIKLSEGYRKARKEAEKEIDIMLETFTKEQIELFDNAYLKIIDESLESAINHYVEGLKFGFKLCLDIFQDEI